jgi:penicillin amidase
LPTTPLILLGRNDKVAWGFTNAGADVQDVFIEQVNEKDNSKYKIPNGWQEFAARNEVIKIKGGADHTFVRRSTRHGPVLPGFYKNLKQLLPSNNVAALQWTGFSTADTSMDAALAIMESDSFEQYVNNASPLLSPMLAMVVADISGTIGLYAPAKVPVRHRNNVIEGRAPVPGWDAKYDWQGMIPVNELPLIKNPPTGAIAAANSRFVDAEYNYHLTYDWEELFRLKRIRKLVVEAGTKHNIESMKSAQADIYSAAFERLRDLLLADIGEIHQKNRKALAWLRGWNALMDMNKPEPLIMNAWSRALVAAVFKDDLPTSFKFFNHQRATVLIRLLEQGGARDWCDKQTTRRVEQCSEIIAQSFDTALDELREEYGKDMAKWRWGKAHVMYGKHQPFSKIWPLSGFFTVTTPSHGGRYTLFRGATKFNDNEHPYRSVHGASYRAVYDLSDLDKSVFIQTTGQSGHFLSRLYSNMTRRWARVEFVSMSTRPVDYNKAALGTWILLPE